MDFTQLISEDALDGYNVPCNNQGNAGQSANQAIINAGSTQGSSNLSKLVTTIDNYDTQIVENEETNVISSPRGCVQSSYDSLFWGQLFLEGGEEFMLYHRTKENKRDTFTIGRKKTNDIKVDDSFKHISSVHCMIYIDYSQARLRIFIEDCSQNGTYINSALNRLGCGQRVQLKSGDLICLNKPEKKDNIVVYNKSTSFTFINLRERMLGGMIAPAPNNPIINDFVKDDNIASYQTFYGNQRHVEDFYIIGEQIGSGMCGTVHEAINKMTEERVAIKIIDTKKFALTPGLSPHDLREEAEMMKKLNHPNIIRIKESFETDKVIFIIMELVSGGDLFDRIIERGRFSEESARSVMHKILDAVKYLHSNKIIHRDLKPENILLVSDSSDVEIKITDFGLAKRTNRDGLKTFCGTPQYFAPEVLQRKDSVAGQGRYGVEADMWSLGVILYILLSGSFPFEEDNLFDQIQNATYSTSGPEWSTISDTAKHLVRSLMCLRIKQRITVTEALNHPWMKGERVMPVTYLSYTNTISKSIPKNKETIIKKKATTPSASRPTSAVDAHTGNETVPRNQQRSQLFWTNRESIISKFDKEIGNSEPSLATNSTPIVIKSCDMEDANELSDDSIVECSDGENNNQQDKHVEASKNNLKVQSIPASNKPRNVITQYFSNKLTTSPSDAHVHAPTPSISASMIENINPRAKRSLPASEKHEKNIVRKKITKIEDVFCAKPGSS